MESKDQHLDKRLSEVQVARMEESAASDSLPPRYIKHAHKKSRWTRYYSMALLWIFILLTIFLIAWGYRHS